MLFRSSLMYGNNEVGTIQPIEQVVKFTKDKGIMLHVDAVQALGFVELNLSLLPIDFMSFSAHKVGGAKGTGALYIADRDSIRPLLYGGNQERSLRAGTENTAGIVGFAAAAVLAKEERASKRAYMLALRETMLNTLLSELHPYVPVVNGHPSQFLPHILNISFPGISTETMLMNLDLDGVAASSGSACSSGSLEISHVLKAMKLPDDVTQSAVRFSFGWGTSFEDVQEAARITANIVRRLLKPNK